VINIKAGGRNGEVVDVALCVEEDHLLLITEKGMIVRSEAAEMRPMGRNTQGVRTVNLKEGDRLVAVEVISQEDQTFDEDEADDTLEPAPAPSPNGGVADADDASGDDASDADDDEADDEADEDDE